MPKKETLEKDENLKRIEHTQLRKEYLVMQMRPFLADLEVVRGIEVIFHHVNEAIVVLYGASGVLDEKSSCVSQTPAYFGAERKDVGGEVAGGEGQVGREINHRKLHCY